MVGGSLHSFAEQSLVGRLDDVDGGASRTNVAAPVGETGVVAISGEIRGLRSGRSGASLPKWGAGSISTNRTED